MSDLKKSGYNHVKQFEDEGRILSSPRVRIEEDVLKTYVLLSAFFSLTFNRNMTIVKKDVSFNLFQTNVSFLTLREKCRSSEFFWSMFSRIRTEYGEILSVRA